MEGAREKPDSRPILRDELADAFCVTTAFLHLDLVCFVRVLDFSRERKNGAAGTCGTPKPTDSQWELIRAAILKALLLYREARDAVAKAIFALCGWED
jgi:hypothetical protein